MDIKLDEINPKIMVSAKTIDLSVSVIPLLSKKFVINSFKINDAVVNLEENAENGANWEFGASKKVENKEEICDLNGDGKFDIRDIIAFNNMINA